ncbi:MAG: M48 family metalloprotease [Planctomycetaceae bacterium]
MKSALIDVLRCRFLRHIALRAGLAGAVVFVCTGCASLPEFSHRAIVTPAEQAGLGAVAVTELLGTSQLSQDQQQIAVTNGIGQRLATASGRDDLDWNFKVVQHRRPIAVALPDGSVFITDALLARCHSEAELAAALAKEMGYMLAGVYPQEVTAPAGGLEYIPLEIGRLTPADQSATKVDDIQAADSIGLSLLVRAGYDPAAAQSHWLTSPPAVARDGRTAFVTRRRNNAAREQSFYHAMVQARSVYQTQAAKLGSGNALAFTASQPLPQPGTAPAPSAPPQIAAGVDATARQPAKSTIHRATSPAHAATGSNIVEFSSDGDFIPPNVHSDRPGDGRWSAVADAPADPPSASAPPLSIEQTSFETSDVPPRTPGPLLP